MNNELYQLGKEASDAKKTYSLAGRLYASGSGWMLLSVPNAIVRGAFSAITEPGVELPTKEDGTLNAHVSVMRKEEVERLGGVDKITERGKAFKYQLGAVKQVDPKNWSGVSRVWYLTVHSPELRQLRTSYGLTPQPNSDWDFHITIAVRKTGVLRSNEIAKAAAMLPPSIRGW